MSRFLQAQFVYVRDQAVIKVTCIDGNVPHVCRRIGDTHVPMVYPCHEQDSKGMIPGCASDWDRACGHVDAIRNKVMSLDRGGRLMDRLAGVAFDMGLHFRLRDPPRNGGWKLRTIYGGVVLGYHFGELLVGAYGNLDMHVWPCAEARPKGKEAAAVRQLHALLYDKARSLERKTVAEALAAFLGRVFREGRPCLNSR